MSSNIYATCEEIIEIHAAAAEEEEAEEEEEDVCSCKISSPLPLFLKINRL